MGVQVGRPEDGGRRAQVVQGLALVAEEPLDEKNSTVKLCMPAPAFCYMMLTPG